MDNLKSLLDEAVKNNFIPPHQCKHHLIILSQTHSVNSLHNIVIERSSKCKICGSIFNEADPRGLK